MRKWMKENMPGTWKFFEDFFNGLNNKPGGHSLRKLLAVGFFWLTAALCLKYTDSSNLSTVVGILCGMITSLIITYSVSNIKQMKIKQEPSEEPNVQEEGKNE
jgi:hypothetical protein